MNLPATTSPDVHLFATHPAELEAAQQGLIEWARAKEREAKEDLTDCRANLQIARKSKWSIAPWQRRVSKAGKILLTYKKVRMALEAGYYIIPPMPFTAFAIRTGRKTPDRKQGEWWGSDRSQNPQHLEPGDGRYVSAQPLERSSSYPSKDRDGNPITKETYWAYAFDDVQFPVTVVKPAVLEATNRAMARQLFDEVGLLERQGCGDPIVAARVLRPGKEPITFFVAWWLDTRDL